MKTELTPIDISGLPELVRLVEEVRKTKQPRVLQQHGEDVGVLAPPKPRGRSRRRRYLTPDDPFWDIVGMSDSTTGPTDVARNKHAYLAEAYRPKST